MQLPKKRNVSARDRLVYELSERGISYDRLPNELFLYRFRDILAYVKQHFSIPYCYRCQHLKHSHEMANEDQNICLECSPDSRTKWRALPESVQQLFKQKEAVQHGGHVAASTVETPSDSDTCEDAPTSLVDLDLEALFLAKEAATPHVSMKEITAKASKDRKPGSVITPEYRAQAVARYNAARVEPEYPHDVQTILKLRSEGLTWEKITEHTNCSSGYISTLLKQHNLTMPRKGQAFSWFIISSDEDSPAAASSKQSKN